MENSIILKEKPRSFTAPRFFSFFKRSTFSVPSSPGRICFVIQSPHPFLAYKTTGRCIGLYKSFLFSFTGSPISLKKQRHTKRIDDACKRQHKKVFFRSSLISLIQIFLFFSSRLVNCSSYNPSVFLRNHRFPIINSTRTLSHSRSHIPNSADHEISPSQRNANSRN